MKSATINARIECELKLQAEGILSQLGLSSAEAIRLFYRQICLSRGLPFDVRLPNQTTIDALEESLERKTLIAKSVKDLLGQSLIKNLIF